MLSVAPSEAVSVGASASALAETVTACCGHHSGFGCRRSLNSIWNVMFGSLISSATTTPLRPDRVSVTSLPISDRGELPPGCAVDPALPGVASALKGVGMGLGPAPMPIRPPAGDRDGVPRLQLAPSCASIIERRLDRDRPTERERDGERQSLDLAALLGEPARELGLSQEANSAALARRCRLPPGGQAVLKQQNCAA